MFGFREVSNELLARSALPERVASRLVRVFAFLMYAPALLLGCAKSETSSQESQPKVASQPGTSVTLRVLVVNEPAVAQAINRLRGEWAERATGEMRAISITWDELTTAKSLDADVVVFPSRYLGELCVRGWLRPLRTNVLQSEDFNSEDFFPLVRRELMKWGGQVMAAPLGVQPAGLDQGASDNLVLTLLSRAAPAVVTADRFGALFDAETMTPRIAEKPFVSALQQMVLPAASEDRSETNRARNVPVLGYNDRLAAVTSTTRNAASAFKLLEWLAQSDTSTQLASAAGGMMPARRSLASSPSWYDSNVDVRERSDLAKALEATLSGERCLLIPRIPGVDEYISALDEAVREAASGSVAPQTALDSVAKRWEVITESRGRESQREAYRKHLGVSEP
jgi:ABC-type glycerol-3-phosphate transport system substrate-binding protein